MLRLYVLVGLGLMGLFAACSSDKDKDSSTGTSTGSGPATATGGGSHPVDATVSASGDDIMLPDGGTVPIVTDAAGNRVAVLPDGTPVTVLPNGDIVTGVPAQTDDWDANVVTDACTQESAGMEGAPAILYLVVDKSTSMNREPESSSPQTKWEATRDALVDAFADMDPSLSVGALFYPNTNNAISDCLRGCAEDVDALSVPIAPLTPEQVTALQEGVRAVPTRTDISGTPTHDAWRVGLTRLQEALGNASAGTQGYLVLMTDGMPTVTLNCDSSWGCLNNDGRDGGSGVSADEWQQILDDAADNGAGSGIKTFVVGVPGSEDNADVPLDPDTGEKQYVPRGMLSQLAIAGGTAAEGCSSDGPDYCHIDMTQTDDFVSSLRDVVGTIAQSVVSCQYTVPEVDIPNVFVNPDDVTVNYYIAGASTPIVLTESKDDCDTGEWVYNDDQTQITLCDSSCTMVHNDPLARIEVDFGCLMPQ